MQVYCYLQYTVTDRADPCSSLNKGMIIDRSTTTHDTTKVGDAVHGTIAVPVTKKEAVTRMSDNYDEKLNKLKESAHKAIEDSGLPVKVAGIVMEWDLPQEAAAAMPQGLMLTGSESLGVAGLVAFMQQVSNFNLALTEFAIRGAVESVKAKATDTPEPEAAE